MAAFEIRVPTAGEVQQRHNQQPDRVNPRKREAVPIRKLAADKIRGDRIEGAAMGEPVVNSRAIGHEEDVCDIEKERDSSERNQRPIERPRIRVFRQRSICPRQ